MPSMCQTTRVFLSWCKFWFLLISYINRIFKRLHCRRTECFDLEGPAAPSDGSTEHLHSCCSPPPAKIPWYPVLNFDAVLASFGIDLNISLLGLLKILGLVLLSRITTHLPLATLPKGLGPLQALNLTPLHYSSLDFLCWLLASHSAWFTELAPASPADGSGPTDCWHQEIN